ncbi:methionine synthase [Prochlorococcus marinus]|uniref:methionine synthase n=1 Tax=Prochlorococcus marinus TaxID=1219 RepID=UPI0022B54975|nr:methionine synthase [Prochlorococcus marinus]
MLNFKDYFNSDPSRIFIFDGAMGTSLQSLDLNANDFGGIALEGCNENLVRTNPLAVEKVHEDYLIAGCDVIETNTFGATSIVLDEYGISNDAYELNIKAASIAKNIAKKYSTKAQPRFVAGSIGPTTKLPTLGHISLDDMISSFQQQVEALIEGKVDLLTVETCQDVLQIKAALIAIKKAFNSTSLTLPVMVSVTMETTGTMLIGTDIAAVLNILEPYNIDILGLNCATGPEQMKSHIKYLSEHSHFPISCIPNAGLPENIGGTAHYKLTPIELRMQLMHFIQDLGVRVIGGCCGTTPDHIKNLVSLKNDLLKSELDLKRSINYENGVSSIYEKTLYYQDKSFLIIGERLNASGSKKVRDLLNNDDWDGLISVAKSQVKEQAHILDVNVDYVGRNGVNDMKEIVRRLVSNVNLPLMLDSTDINKIESGLKNAGGKCIINSTNYEDGEIRFKKFLDLARDYGSALVIGTIDEDGMARSASKKIDIVNRSYKECINCGISEYDLFYDPLVLPISTGLEEDRKNASETLKAISQIKEKYPNVHIVLGISNISFGLNSSARITLNSVFLNECIKCGLDSAIISPAKILPLSKIDPKHLKLCLDLIYDKRIIKDSICKYDPLTELTTEFTDITTKNLRDSNEDFNLLPLEDKLKQHIIDGERTSLEDNLKEALKKYQPLTIINSYLLDGMKEVGELFGSGQMQLPFVLQSAETMKFAVSILEPYMDDISDANNSKGILLIATVKGDVHDIGKNLVDIILTNNGYQVINLGIKQDISEIITAHKKYRPDCIAMSGLLVKSTAFMKDNLLTLNNEGITTPVILGGAALTPKFVNVDCNSVYMGQVIYGKDAFTDLRFMDVLMKSKSESSWDDKNGFINNTKLNNDFKLSNLSSSQKLKSSANNIITINNNNSINTSSTKKSHLIKNEQSITPPFIGTKVIIGKDIKIDDIVYYLDKKALFVGQWQLKRNKNQSKQDYEVFLDDKAEPILNKWINIIKSKSLISPAIVYGYFPCARNGNSLDVYNFNKKDLLGSFIFPRQKGSSRYCISDFFNKADSNKPNDFIPMQAVTMGEIASNYAQSLFNQNKYLDYLYFHGLTVQLAEALAEYSHSIIRKECGFSSNEPDNIRGILSQKYQGCRYSFGYPACPQVSDSFKQLKWLDADRIGLRMDKSDQLIPEQSTTAIISLHSQAKYFSA